MKNAFRYFGAAFFIFFALLFVYWLLLCYPQLFFRQEQVGNLHIYHHSDPTSVKIVGERALEKIKKSTLYDSSVIYRVFLTDSTAEYAFFTTLWRGSGGVFLIFARGNIFIRPSKPALDRLIAPTGELVGADRPLNYFIAHEAAHAMTYEKIGFTRYNALHDWVREGIADRIARESFDYEENLKKFRSGAKELNPAASGLYLKYQLLVEYALKYRRFNEEKLLEANPDGSIFEAELKDIK